MTLYLFNALPYERQLVAVFDTGHLLMTRWEEEFAFKLYELPGRFFVEVEFDTTSNNIVQLRSFTSLKPLEDYEVSIQLPDWLT
jgi:hypothetical protein